MFTPNRIGTPLSPSATTVMLLGSGELGKEMAIAFQRLGVEVHAVDSYENAPAHQVAQTNGKTRQRTPPPPGNPARRDPTLNSEATTTPT